MANKARSCFYCSLRPSFHRCWQIQGVGSSEPGSFCKGDFLLGRCLAVQQTVPPVHCSACKLAWQPGSLHPPGKICKSLNSIKKGRREGNAESPFSSEITKPHHCYLADIWTCSNIQQFQQWKNGHWLQESQDCATGFIPVKKWVLRIGLCSPLRCEDTNRNLFTLKDSGWSFPWTTPYNQKGDAQSGDASAFLFSIFLQQCQYNLNFCSPNLNIIWIFQVLQEDYITA